MRRIITFYWKGDKAVYTGKAQTIHGARCYEFVLLEGEEEGKHKWTYRCPHCGSITCDIK